MTATPKPVVRSPLRRKLGYACYGALRRLLWLRMKKEFAVCRSVQPLPFCAYAHQTVLRRKLRNVDMWMQENKIVNLRLAAAQLNGILLRPGEVFSYWYLIGKPSAQKGYVPGMILRNGQCMAGTGGGLCQLSNLICWMTVHTPLTVIERHRHGYDVFPDSNRTQPFASGATCSYPHVDLMIRNDTQETYQLLVRVGEEYLEGEWRCTQEPPVRYEIVERNHEMRAEYWGGYTRHNELYQQCFDKNGTLLSETLLFKNSAVMMYPPYLSENCTAEDTP